jgi:hypothetical protein
MYIPDAGAGLRVLGATSSELVRSAAERFVRSVLTCAGFMFGQDTDQTLSAISALPYEGRDGVGNLILAPKDTADVEVLLRLRRPVNIRQTRAIRKLMEAGGSVTALVVAEVDMAGQVHALGRISPSYDTRTETAFRVSAVGRGAWDLYHGETALLSVRDGVARLPAHVLDVATLRDLVERLLPGADYPVLEHVARIAGENDHGAMLVVSSDAPREAARLSPQSWVVEPSALSTEMIRQLTAMDGAILVDPQGQCHAIGVILDGRAAGQGDPGRGSRFNNVVRYLDNDPPPAVVVVYSTDGTIDILPQLRPRVRREDVSNAVAHYLKVSLTRPPNLEVTSKAWDAVKALKFYLSEDQCNELNAARAALDEWEKSRTQIWIVEDDLAPSPGMNDSYWL